MCALDHVYESNVQELAEQTNFVQNSYMLFNQILLTTGYTPVCIYLHYNYVCYVCCLRVVCSIYSIYIFLNTIKK